MINRVTHLSIEAITELYEDAFIKFDDRRVLEIEVSFYPYVGLNHTIRVRDGRVLVRIAEVCRTMSAAGHRALAEILVAKLLGKRVPKTANKAYAESVRDREIQEKADHVKRTRGRKRITGAVGDVYDLGEVFGEVNDEYFRGSIPRPTLTWSTRRTFRILGHHDATHDTIVISKSLDDEKVPRFIVKYVVFHEMLHIHHPTKVVGGKRYNHTPEFRRDEKKFKDYRAAEKWIEDNVGKLKRRARRERRA
jgi:hypothetical protein